MSAERAEDRRAASASIAAQVGDLLDAVAEVVVVEHLVEADRDRLEVAAGEAAVRVEALEDDPAGLSRWKNSSSSLMATKPPMLAIASFFALMRTASASASCSRAISRSGTSANPSSRSRTNHAFSAKRAMSRTSFLPWPCVTRATSRMFCIDTGWPPPALFVIVSMTIGHALAVLALEQLLETVDVDVPLERRVGGGVERLRRPAGRARCPSRTSMCARVVSKCAFDGTISPGSMIAPKKMLSAPRPW